MWMMVLLWKIICLRRLLSGKNMIYKAHNLFKTIRAASWSNHSRTSKKSISIWRFSTENETTCRNSLIVKYLIQPISKVHILAQLRSHHRTAIMKTNLLQEMKRGFIIMKQDPENPRSSKCPNLAENSWWPFFKHRKNPIDLL